MNYTQNYHLPQWVKSDRILMDDFNNAMAAIESGIKAADTKAGNAQSTATTAVNKKNYVTGSFTGTGTTENITLGFRPSFLIVSGMKEALSAGDAHKFTCFFGATGGTAISKRLGITASGFTVYFQEINLGDYPNFTEAGRTYDYIAFR